MLNKQENSMKILWKIHRPKMLYNINPFIGQWMLETFFKKMKTRLESTEMLFYRKMLKMQCGKMSIKRYLFLEWDRDS